MNPATPEPQKRLLPLRHTSSGWAILEVHYSAVPGYDFDAASLGLSQQAIRTELEIDFEATTGKAVYPEFSRALHVSPEPLSFDPRRPLFIGLDVPGTPAAVVTQLDVFGRWCILSNLSPPEDEVVGYYEFFQVLADHLQQEYAEPAGVELAALDVQFYGDPAGRAKIPAPGQSPKEARSCWDILTYGLEMVVGVDERGNPVVERKPGWGWRPRPGAVDITRRLEAVRARLTTILRGGVPALVIDPGCRTVIEGFAGAYCYRQRSDGRFELDPDKGFHSHTLDALAYPCTRLFARGKEEEDDWEPRREVVSRAAARSVRRASW